MCVVTREIGKSREQAFFEEFSTHMSLVHSIHGLPNILTSLGFTDKSAKHSQLFLHTYSAWNLPLKMQPVFTNFSHHFLIEFVVGGHFQLSSELSLNSYHRFHWMKLQHTKCFLQLSCILTSVPYSGGNSWKYYLNMHAKNTFWVALYHGVLLFFVWQLLSYQHIYVIISFV